MSKYDGAGTAGGGEGECCGLHLPTTTGLVRVRPLISVFLEGSRTKREKATSRVLLATSGEWLPELILGIDEVGERGAGVAFSLSSST